MFNFVKNFFERRRLEKEFKIFLAQEAERIRLEEEAARKQHMAEAGAELILGLFVGLISNIVNNPLPPFPKKDTFEDDAHQVH